jgi:hypothetical protein
MKEFNLTEYEGIDYILNTINIADLVCFPRPRKLLYFHFIIYY